MKMIKRFMFISFVLITCITLFNGCSVTSIEVDPTVFFILKDWKINKVIVNGSEETDTDLSAYRLLLFDDFTFTRINIDRADDGGNWTLRAEQSQLVLHPDDPREERYLILDIQIRRLELKVLQDDFKSGEFDIRYILEPVKK